MRCKLFLQSSFVGLLLVSVGCESVNTTERAEPVGQRQMILDKRVITDPTLNRRVRIVGVNESATPEGFLKVQVELLNTTRALQHFSYRFEWFDARGMQVNAAAAAFVPRQIEGRESIFLSEMAPTAGAKDFRLKLIENVR